MAASGLLAVAVYYTLDPRFCFIISSSGRSSNLILLQTDQGSIE